VKRFFARLWHEQDGVLSFEWTVLTSLLTVGVVSGIASVRDSVVDEMGDLSQAMVNLDQSYYIEPPLGIRVHSGGYGGWGFSNAGYGGWGYGGSAASSSQFIDASSYLLLKRTWMGKDKDGKSTLMSVRFGDYKKVQGRMVNHSVEWDAPDGTSSKSAVSGVAFDKKLDAKLFAMPK
jgi:Flp pilus assembly pilin Flp